MKPYLSKAGFILIFILAVMPSIHHKAQTRDKNLPKLPKSGVVVPWEDFKTILDKLQAAPPPVTFPAPPVDYALSECSAEITVQGGEDKARVVLDFYVQILNRKKWVEVPVLANGIALSSFRIDGSPAVVYNKSGSFYVAMRGSGRHHFVLEYLSRISNSSGSRSLRLQFPKAPAITASISIPRGNLEVLIPNAVIQSIDRKPGLTKVKAAFQQAWGSTATWSKRIETDDKESKVFGEQACMLSIGEGLIKGTSFVSYAIHGKGLDSFRLILPSDVTVLDVHAAGIADWSVAPDPQKPGRSVLSVKLNFMAKKSYSFSVSFEKALQGTTAKTKLPDLELSGVLRDKGFLAIAAATNVEVTPEGKIENATRVDPSETPSSLRAGSGNSILYSYKYLKHPVVIPINIVKHEEVSVKQTIVESAELTTFLSREGKLISSALYRIKNNRKQYLALRLPGNAVIWGAYLESRPVKPALRKDGAVLVPLKKTALDASGQLRAFTLEIVYLQPGSLSSIIGKIKAEGPILLDVDILEAQWDFFLPRSSKYFDFGGNLHEDPLKNRILYLGDNAYNLADQDDLSLLNTRKIGGQSVITDGISVRGLDKVSVSGKKGEGKLSAGAIEGMLMSKQAAVKTRSKLDEEEMQKNIPPPPVPQAAMSNVAVQAYLSSPLPGGNARGVLPVKIEIPRAGLRLTFTGRLLTNGEAPIITMHRVPSGWSIPSWGGTWTAVLAFFLSLGLILLVTKEFGELTKGKKYILGTGLIVLAMIFAMAGGHRLTFLLAMLTALIAFLGWRYWKKRRQSKMEAAK